MRDSFIFYRSFYEAISDLENAQQLKLYQAMAEYSLNFKEPDLSGVEGTIFKLIKPQLEANNKRYANGSKPKQKQSGSKTEAKPKQDKSKVEANKNVNKNKNVNANEFGVFISELKAKSSIKSKVTLTKDGEKLFKSIGDKDKLMKDYIAHQLDKGNYAQRITAFMEDYKTVHSKSGASNNLLHENTIGGYRG